MKAFNEVQTSVIISEPTAELLTMQDTMYKKAASLFVNELYDELVNSGILYDKNIFCNKMLQDSAKENPPYIAESNRLVALGGVLLNFINFY